MLKYTIEAAYLPPKQYTFESFGLKRIVEAAYARILDRTSDRLNLRSHPESL